MEEKVHPSVISKQRHKTITVWKRSWMFPSDNANYHSIQRSDEKREKRCRQDILFWLWQTYPLLLLWWWLTSASCCTWNGTSGIVLDVRRRTKLWSRVRTWSRSGFEMCGLTTSPWTVNKTPVAESTVSYNSWLVTPRGQNWYGPKESSLLRMCVRPWWTADAVARESMCHPQG